LQVPTLLLLVLRSFCHLLFFSTLIALPQRSTAQTMRVQSLTVRSTWGGFSPSRPEPTELIIRRQSDGFYSNAEKVDASLVEALINALSAPPIATPQLSNLGVTQAWLNDNVDLVAERTLRYRVIQTAHVDAYRSFFKNAANIESLLPLLFTGLHTDDYPSVSVEILFDGGEVWSASSGSQYEFMIPWTVRARRPDFRTFNADVSRNIANLLPLKSVNRNRLVGDSLNFSLAEAALTRIEEQWLNPALSVLQPQYKVERSDIRQHGEIWSSKQREQESAFLILRRDSFPDRFQDIVYLPFRNERVDGTYAFLKAAAKYESLALSIAWLNDIRRNGGPLWRMYLYFTQDRSFSDEAMKVFADDMSHLGREDLVKMVAAVQQDTALLDVGWSTYCLVLPNKNVILWRFHNPPGSRKVVNWSRGDDFPAKECTTLRNIEWCAGVVITPEGNIVK